MHSGSLRRPLSIVGIVVLTGLVAACANQPQSTSGYPAAYGSSGPAMAPPAAVPPGMAATFTTTADLHLRAAPGAHAPIVATLPAGTQVQTNGRQDGNWVGVQTRDGIGWVYRRYLAPG